MPMTVVVTRNVVDRFRGFLASCMLEIAPGVYTSPQMSKAVRERVWTVLEDWFQVLGSGCIVLTWQDSSAPSGQSLKILGEPPVELVNCEGVWLTLRESPPDTETVT